MQTTADDNGHAESCSGKLRNELLDGKGLDMLAEAKGVIEGWRRHHDTVRPYSPPRYGTPASEVLLTPASPFPTGPELSGSMPALAKVH